MVEIKTFITTAVMTALSMDLVYFRMTWQVITVPRFMKDARCEEIAL